MAVWQCSAMHELLPAGITTTRALWDSAYSIVTVRKTGRRLRSTSINVVARLQSLDRLYQLLDGLDRGSIQSVNHIAVHSSRVGCRASRLH